MKKICVFCGSNLGANKIYEQIASDLGRLLVKENIELIYGGANVGLMRITAEEVLKNGGKATGVITHFLAQKHLAQEGLTKLITVNTMQERKAMMAELADGFIALPGGFGTLEELFEVLTAAQLGFHDKPVSILNVNGFYDFLKKQLDIMVTEGMLLKPHSKIAHFAKSPREAIEEMKKYERPIIEKWIDDVIKESGKKLES